MTDPSKSVATPSEDHDRTMKLCKLPRALMQGTKGMRAAGARAVGNAAYTDWLPREPAETPAAYTARLYRSTLFNAFKKAVKDFTGRVFRRPIVLGEDVPDLLRAYAENIDLTGRHLNVFGRDMFQDGLVTGINYILVEMPVAAKNADGSPATIAQEQSRKARPYFCLVKAEDLIGFKYELINDVLTLTQARIRETASEPDGEFGEKSIEQIRVLTIGGWQIWRQATTTDGRGDWAIFSEGSTSLKYIPLVPNYAHRTGFMLGEPPLEDLADLNVSHWQSSSDQRAILHIARVPILFGAGFADDVQLTVGVNTMVRASDPNARLEFVEHSGAAIGAGQTDLDKLELQMAALGLNLLIPQPGGKTATGEIRDETKENSQLAMMAMALGDALEGAFGIMADYLGLGADKGGSVTCNTNFGLIAGQGDLQTLLGAVNANQISKETFWTELKRRDVLADDFAPDIEKDRLASAPPELDGQPLN